MIKLISLMIFLLMGSYSLRADEMLGKDQELMNELNNIKNPFEDGLPKPVAAISIKPIDHPQAPTSKPKPKPRPKPVPLPVGLPDLRLQGVMVGEDMHEAIINNQIVPLQGTIEGARVVSVSNRGVELFYKGKKFFLKVD